MLAIITFNFSCLPEFISKNIKINLKRIAIFCFLLVIRENSSLPLREGRRLRVFENRVLRRIFGPKRDVVTVQWRELYEEFNDRYFQSIFFR